ncbi:MAG: NUDIX domain-containing protein [Clostridia bacterium]|nr:NUDIX domain-containing protein [Clostridia bacterium]
MKCVVTAIIKKDNQCLMVQEAKESCYGKWNFPGGGLKAGENVIDAIKREVKEETGFDIELIGILAIQNLIDTKNKFKIVFNANVISGEVSYDKSEILKVKWFSMSELENMDKSKLRNEASLLEIIKDIKEEKNYPLKMIKNIHE